MIKQCLIAVLIFLILPATYADDKSPPKDMEAIQMTLKKHDESFNRHDLTGVISTYAPGEKTVLLGTGPGERWVGREEIQTAYVEFFKDFDPNTSTHLCTWNLGDIKNDLAWFVAMCQFTDYLKNQKREFALNISTVLEKIENQWYFRVFHFSNLTGDQ